MVIDDGGAFGVLVGRLELWDGEDGKSKCVASKVKILNLRVGRGVRTVLDVSKNSQCVSLDAMSAIPIGLSRSLGI